MNVEWGIATKKPIQVKFRKPKPLHDGPIGPYEVLSTGHGTAFAFIGKDYVIEDELGEYPINIEMFKKTYDVVRNPFVFGCINPHEKVYRGCTTKCSQYNKCKSRE